MAKEFHAVVQEIEPLHFLGAAHHVGQHLAEWHDDIEEVERRADGIRQQGTENEVILLVKEDDLRVTDSQAGPRVWAHLTPPKPPPMMTIRFFSIGVVERGWAPAIAQAMMVGKLDFAAGVGCRWD